MLCLVGVRDELITELIPELFNQCYVVVLLCAGHIFIHYMLHILFEPGNCANFLVNSYFPFTRQAFIVNRSLFGCAKRMRKKKENWSPAISIQRPFSLCVAIYTTFTQNVYIHHTRHHFHLSLQPIFTIIISSSFFLLFLSLGVV